MLVKSAERAPLGQLLAFLELGEHLAHDCALQQATLAPDPSMHHFFLNQARQERSHAHAFHTATLWLGEKHLGSNPYIQTLNRFRTELEWACREKQFLISVLAEQVILEGLGEVMLKKLEGGLVKRQAPFQKLRRLLLLQEEAHHGFGIRVLEQAITNHETSISQLRHQAKPFIALAEHLIVSIADLLYTIDEHPHWYLEEFHKHLPKWMNLPNGDSTYIHLSILSTEAHR